MTPNILISTDGNHWPMMAHGAIITAVHAAIERHDICHLMLTGGRTAQRLYEFWAQASDVSFDRMYFYFGDERCVSPDHADSNFGLVMKTLFSGGVPSGCTIERMEGENSDREAAARTYERLLPPTMDVLLLGMGEDAHIASLFPGSEALRQTDRSVVPTVGPKPPYERLTITRKVITDSTSVFLLVTGEKKGEALQKVLESPENFMSMPACLTLGGTWLLDHEAGSRLI